MIPIDEKHIIKKLKTGDNEVYKYIYESTLKSQQSRPN